MIALLNVLFWLQESSQIEMADKFREEGKIYVVLAIVLLILTGLFIYLIRISKRVSNLEKSDNIK